MSGLCQRETHVFFTRPELLVCLFDIPVHFQARQQFDIAWGAIYAGFLHAPRLVCRAGLGPDRRKLIARLRLIGRAALLDRRCAAFGPALCSGIEFRQAIRYRNERERSK